MSAPRLVYPAPWVAHGFAIQSDENLDLSSKAIVSAHNDLHEFALEMAREVVRLNALAGPADPVRLALAREYLEAHK